MLYVSAVGRKTILRSIAISTRKVRKIPMILATMRNLRKRGKLDENARRQRVREKVKLVQTLDSGYDSGE
jgi:hypothetical protein